MGEGGEDRGPAKRACSYSAVRPGWHVLIPAFFHDPHTCSHASIDIIQKTGNEAYRSSKVEVGSGRSFREEAEKMTSTGDPVVQLC